MPSISVIMPCYNHERFVRESVASILQQTIGDLELIVVDDKSNDDSVQVLRNLAIKDSRLKLIVHSQNLGASRSRNDGLAAASGDLFAFCDADDLWKPEKLERQIKLLRVHGGCDITYCDSQIIDSWGLPTGEFFSDQFPPPSNPSGDLFQFLCTRNFVNMTTVLVRREALGAQVYFDESVRWVEDWWQWIKLSYNHQFVYDPQVLAKYRVHPQSTGFIQKPGISRNRWKICKRNLRTHCDMPLSVQALIWNLMGTDLCSWGKRRKGCRFLTQALSCGWTGGLSWYQLAKICTRLGLEWGRNMRNKVYEP